MTDKIRTIASLGALPPGKRVIEYTHEYTKTYRNTYYQVVDEARAEQLEELVGRDEFWEESWSHNDDVPGFKEQLRWLMDQQEPCYDSEETDEEFRGVELLGTDIDYDPSDADQREAVERGWNDHIAQQKTDALNLDSPRLIDDAVQIIREHDQFVTDTKKNREHTSQRDYDAVKQTT